MQPLIDERFRLQPATMPLRPETRDEVRRTLALRIAHRNSLRELRAELRAERLARLRPAGTEPAAGFEPGPDPAFGELAAPEAFPKSFPEAGPATGPVDAAAALEDFLRALTGSPAATEAEKPVALPPAEILSFARLAPLPSDMLASAPVELAPVEPALFEPEPRAEPDPAAVCDLGLLSGAGEGLVWALQRAGIARLADLAPLAPAELVARLGPLGRLVPASAWIARARAATA